MSSRKHAKVLALIPARSGSKRVQDKNLRLLGGKPLLAHSIQIALASAAIDNVVVSTNDEKIARVAGEFNAAPPFMRPNALAQDATPDRPVLIHALDELQSKGLNYDLLVLLRPTAPFRSLSLIDACIEKWKSSEVDAVRSMTKAEGIHHPYWMFNEVDGEAVPVIKGKSIEEYYQSQLLPPVYHLNGVVDAISTSVIRNGKTLYGEHVAILETPSELAVDIDTEEDFEYAEFLWQKRNPK